MVGAGIDGHLAHAAGGCGGSLGETTGDLAQELSWSPRTNALGLDAVERGKRVVESIRVAGCEIKVVLAVAKVFGADGVVLGVEGLVRNHVD